MAALALSMRGVHKDYAGLEALKGVDLDVQQGEVVALLGPNGAGKTTLMAIASGLRQRTSGTVLVLGHDPSDAPVLVHSMLGYVPQDLGLYPGDTVTENIDYMARLHGLSKSKRRQRTQQVEDLLDLERLSSRRAATLSGGEQRRLHTAMGLVHAPKLLLLDEPTVAADVSGRSRLLAAVRALAASGTGICYTTHYLAELEELRASVVVIMSGGRVVARGSVEDIVGRASVPKLVITFKGPAPLVAIRGALPPDGESLTVKAEGRGVDVVQEVLDALGEARHRVRSLSYRPASIESAFTELTGGEQADAT